VGSEIACGEGLRLVLLAPDRKAYGALASLITTGRRRAEKSTDALRRAHLGAACGDGPLALILSGAGSAFLLVRRRFPGHSWIAAELHCGPNDHEKLSGLKEISAASGLPLVAAGGVHMHLRSRRRLQDALTAIRLGTPVARCGKALFSNGERHLRMR